MLNCRVVDRNRGGGGRWHRIGRIGAALSALLIAVTLAAPVEAQDRPKDRARAQAATHYLGPVATAPKTVPDLSGQTEAQAAATLKPLELRLRPSYVATCEKQTTPATIWDQVPPLGAAIPQDRIVSVKVAPPPAVVLVPSLGGLTAGQAQQRLEGNRLCLGTVTQGEVAGQIGTVVEPTDPRAQTRVRSGTRVNVTVVGGKHDAKPPPSSATLVLFADETDVRTDVPVTFSIRLNASADLSDANVRYAIQFGDGESTKLSYEIGASHRYRHPGAYRATAIAVVNNGKLASDPVEIRVAEVESPPFDVELSVVPRMAQAGTQVSFIAQPSRAAAETRYSFDFGDGYRSEWTGSFRVEHAYGRPGRYYARVAAASGNQRAQSSIVVVDVRGGQSLWPLIVLAGLGVIGWFARKVWKHRREARRQLARIALDGKKNPHLDSAEVHEEHVITQQVQLRAVPAPPTISLQTQGLLVRKSEIVNG